MLTEELLAPLQIFRFYYRCTACAAEFVMKTDPKNADYTMEAGASRNHEPWREKDIVKAQTAVRSVLSALFAG